MYLLYYKISKDYFYIQEVNFSKDFYDDLEVGYLNREGDLLVLIIVYNLMTKCYEVTPCFWLWRECQNLKIG